MENKDVPYIVHEGSVARLERTNKRLMIVAVVAIVLMFLTNALWLYMWNQYDYSSYDMAYSQDGEGVNVMGDGNEVNDGAETEGKGQSEEETGL